MSLRPAQLAWEQRWSRPTAFATLAAVALIIASLAVASKGIGGSNGDADAAFAASTSTEAQS